MANCKICGKSINTHAWYCDDCIKKIQTGKITQNEKDKNSYILDLGADSSDREEKKEDDKDKKNQVDDIIPNGKDDGDYTNSSGADVSNVEKGAFSEEKNEKGAIRSASSFGKIEYINKLYFIPIVLGLLLIVIGLIKEVPGGALTTYKELDGVVGTDGYFIYNKFSAIDEYVGGDAYNLIIGASLVGGRIAGSMTQKSVFMAGGLICICIGIMMYFQTKLE